VPGPLTHELTSKDSSRVPWAVISAVASTSPALGRLAHVVSFSDQPVVGSERSSTVAGWWSRRLKVNRSRALRRFFTPGGTTKDT